MESIINLTELFRLKLLILSNNNFTSMEKKRKG
jgi:hypothetical protein